MINYKEIRTSNERKAIYQILRKYGVSVANAQRLRDWSLSHIEQFLCNFFDTRTVGKIMEEIRREVKQ